MVQGCPLGAEKQKGSTGRRYCCWEVQNTDSTGEQGPRGTAGHTPRYTSHGVQTPSRDAGAPDMTHTWPGLHNECRPSHTAPVVSTLGASNRMAAGRYAVAT